MLADCFQYIEFKERNYLHDPVYIHTPFCHFLGIYWLRHSYSVLINELLLLKKTNKTISSVV